MRKGLPALLYLGLLVALPDAARATPRGVDAPGMVEMNLYPPVPVRSPIPSDPVRFCKAGACTVISRSVAHAAGYTLVDFTDEWAPRLFADAKSPSGKVRVNTYRKRFVGLANDLVDLDGDPLAKWHQNYLELYGIPPSLSLLVKRWRRDRANEECFGEIDFDAIAAFEGSVRFRGRPEAWIQRRNRLRRQVTKEMRRRKLDTPEALLAVPARVKLVEDYFEAKGRVAMVEAVQKRLKCERIWSRWRRIKPGFEDWVTRDHIGQFERKHRIFGYGHLRGPTLKALATSADVLGHEDLLRVLTERIADAAGILEDGSVPGSVDLISQFRDAFAEAVGITTPAQAFDWFDRVLTYDRLAVAFEAPPKPAYYSEHMDLSLELDRGDVWYEFPYNEKGRRQPQKRSRRPQLTVYVTHDGQRIPLVKWKTTIGAWRTEMVQDGYVYLKYKNSDVGKRLMRQIIAAPVWIPPASTPVRELVKKKKNKKTKKREWVVNYDEIGPGHKSAYGLVAGYLLEHVCRRDGSKCWDRDHGIRIHGSADYMSILARYSHGCHRLYNHLAVRHYNFILRHRKHRARGETILDYEREFSVRPKDDEELMEFQIELATRGFRYFLDPPLPVEVLEGRIRGKAKKPIEGYMRIPDKEYAVDAWVPLEGGEAKPPPQVIGAPCVPEGFPLGDREGPPCRWQGQEDALECRCPDPEIATAAAAEATEGTAGPEPTSAPSPSAP